MLNEEGIPPERVVFVSGIGCHAKTVDYVNVSSFYSIHGRTVPVAEAIKLADSSLKVICFAGDGDAYGEGLEHLIFAAKRNADITMIIHNNRVYGLTTGQYTPTSPKGFKGRSTPQGSPEIPLNPLELMLVAGATYIGRGFSNNLKVLKDLFRGAVLHKGFALIDVLQVCVTFFNAYEYYNQKTYELQGHDPGDFNQAITRIREWDYNSDARIPLGLFYKQDMPTYEDAILQGNISVPDRGAKIRRLLETSL